jgi:hypothetical protein
VRKEINDFSYVSYLDNVGSGEESTVIKNSDSTFNKKNFKIFDKMRGQNKNPIFISSEKSEFSNTENFSPKRNVPGGGVKIIFIFQLKDHSHQTIKSIVDCGSSVSLVNKRLIEKYDISKTISLIPVTFWGLFGKDNSEDHKKEIAVIHLECDKHRLSIPAYLVNSLPFGVDMLLGMDQIGKNIGININPMSEFSISLYTRSNQEMRYRLSLDPNGRSVSNRSPPWLLKSSGIKQTSDILMEDEANNEDEPDTSVSRIVTSYHDDSKTALRNEEDNIISSSQGTSIRDTPELCSILSESEILEYEVRGWCSSSGPPIVDNSERSEDSKLLPIILEMKAIRVAILTLKEKMIENDGLEKSNRNTSTLQKGLVRGK